MKNIPNYLSLLRIALSVILLWINNWFIFLTIYLICGFSDALDGYIARRYKLETNVGAKLDSLADFFFFITALTCMIYSYGLRIPDTIIIGGIIVSGIRMLNFGITKRKFKQFGILHTVGNKLSGITIFLACPWAIVSGDMSLAIIMIPLLSALEETLILFKTDNYNPNISSLFKLTRECNNNKMNNSNI